MSCVSHRTSHTGTMSGTHCTSISHFNVPISLPLNCTHCKFLHLFRSLVRSFIYLFACFFHSILKDTPRLYRSFFSYSWASIMSGCTMPFREDSFFNFVCSFCVLCLLFWLNSYSLFSCHKTTLTKSTHTPNDKNMQVCCQFHRHQVLCLWYVYDFICVLCI